MIAWNIFVWDLSLEAYPHAPWIFQFGGLVPLLVAYEEELRELRVSSPIAKQKVPKKKRVIFTWDTHSIHTTGSLLGKATLHQLEKENWLF